MKCIWITDEDKVKGFKCEFSPVDMLIVVSGLKYITADIERHPKDRERAQYIYNKIMLSRCEDEAEQTEPTISKTEQVDKDINVRCKEPQTIRCPKCGRSDYIREFGKDFSVTAEKAGFKYKCINCNTYIKDEP